MLNFFITFVVFVVSFFLMAAGVRYGMLAAGKFDNWLATKSRHDFTGFDWYFRIPFSIGMIPEYFFGMVLGKDNYFKTNWWALKISSFLAVLLFVALLQSRSDVAAYYSLSFISENGFTGYFTSGTFVWYLNFITLLYISLAVLLVVESIKLVRGYAPLRILFYGVLCLFMAGLTISVLTLIVFASLIYLAFKVIKFLFFNQNNRGKIFDEDEETAGDILRGGFSKFKIELKEWEAERKSTRRIKTSASKRKTPAIKRKVKVTPPTKRSQNYDDIPRLHPD